MNSTRNPDGCRPEKSEAMRMIRMLKVLLGLVVGVGILLGGFLLVATLWNPTPDAVEPLTVGGNPPRMLSVEEDFTVTTFNIGYAGLDKDQDFFFDGGTMGRSKSREKTLENLEGMQDFLREADPDFILFQEVDRNSLRTYRIDQHAFFQEGLPGYGSVFASNYTALWVPVPVLKPMGDVHGGMATFSRYLTLQAERYALEGQESWPMKLFELDRCFIETVHPLDNGKSLIMVNLHLSAYDAGGELRNAQSAHLKRYIEERYAEGHYVVLGGDWNQLISDIQREDPGFLESWPSWLVEVQADFEEMGFQWGVGEAMTVRDLDAPYVPGVTFETIIDGFLVSPNLEIVEVTGHDLGFTYSDHNPVSIRLRFR